MTLNQIVDDIYLTIQAVDPKKTEALERRQVEYWVDLYRMVILRQDIDKNSIIDPSYISYQEFNMMPVAPGPGTLDRRRGKGMLKYTSEENLPKLPTLTGRYALLSVYRLYDQAVVNPLNVEGGSFIPISDWSRVSYMWADPWTKGNIQRATIMPAREESNPAESIGQKLHIYTSETAPMNQFVVSCGMVLCNPLDYYPKNYIIEEQQFRNLEYPMPNEHIPRVKQLIFTNELPWVLPPQQSLQAAQNMKVEGQGFNSNQAAALQQQGADLYDR